jgi:hypothetical protein
MGNSGCKARSCLVRFLYTSRATIKTEIKLGGRAEVEGEWDIIIGGREGLASSRIGHIVKYLRSGGCARFAPYEERYSRSTHLHVFCHAYFQHPCCHPPSLQPFQIPHSTREPIYKSRVSRRTPNHSPQKRPSQVVSAWRLMS